MTIDWNYLSADIEPHEVKWLPQATAKDDSGNTVSALAIPYIDARTVFDILDRAVGYANWQTDLEYLGNRCYKARIGIRDTETGEWIWKENASDDTAREPHKGGASTAFKRTALLFGIGDNIHRITPQRVAFDGFKFTETPKYRYVPYPGEVPHQPSTIGGIDFEMLQSPYPSSSLSVRVGTITRRQDKALALTYVDGLTVVNRLNEVVGVQNWQCSFEQYEKGVFICRVRIRVNGEWLTRTDVGEMEDGVESVAFKGGATDALKRAFVHWGNRDLYRLPQRYEAYDATSKTFKSKVAAEISPLEIEAARTYNMRMKDMGFDMADKKDKTLIWNFIVSRSLNRLTTINRYQTWAAAVEEGLKNGLLKAG